MRFFQRLMVAATLLRGRPLRLWASFGATLAHWLLLGVAGWGLAVGLGMDVHPLTMATILVAATFFTSAVPSLPGGLGTYHFAIISMLNALDVMPEGGELVVTSWKGATYFELEVADSGPGIDEASNQKLFEPFFTTKSGGTGLGLAIVDRIVAAHDGDVTVGNCHEGGAAFTLRIPQRAMEAAA